jgi:hypothetical protein
VLMSLSQLHEKLELNFMHRPDRIDFPCITSDELWEMVSEDNWSPNASPRSVSGERSARLPVHRIFETPTMMSPERITLTSSSEMPNYFRYREENNLVTPAQTPSDILRRGPLYECTPSEAETEPTTACTFPSKREEFLRRQIDYHRERQTRISQFMTQFLERMQDLRDWHEHQESKYIEELGNRAKPKSAADSFPATVD